MNVKDVVVRIVQPAEKPHITAVKTQPIIVEENKNPIQSIVNSLGIAVIAGLALYLGFSFFHIGVNVNDIVVILGIPMAVGLVASYVVF